MAYEPKTKAGKAALADGADITVVEGMEESGELKDEVEETAIETEEEKEKRIGDENEAKGLNRDGSAKKTADGEDDETQPNRNPTHMPAWAHKEEVKKAEDKVRGELQTQITDLTKQLDDLRNKPGGTTDDDIKSIADEFGLEPKVAEAMIDKMTSISSKKLGLDGVKETLDEAKKFNQDKKEAEGFETEFTSEATQKALKEILGDKEISQSVKAKVKEFAYSTNYARYRLQDIIRLETSSIFGVAPKQSKTAEAGRGGTARGEESKTIDEMTPEEINNLPDDEFIKLSDQLGGKGSKFKIIKPVKTSK